MKRNPVVWFEIYVDDMERAVKFYETVLDIKLESMPVPDLESEDFNGMQMMAFPSNQETYGAAGTLVKMNGVTPGGVGTIVYFDCADCAVEEARVESAGGKVFREKVAIGEHGFMVMVIDTEGNMIGLHSMK